MLTNRAKSDQLREEKGIPHSRAKTYAIVWPIEGTNKVDDTMSKWKLITGIRKFCRENPQYRLDYRKLVRVANKVATHNRGFVAFHVADWEMLQN